MKVKLTGLKQPEKKINSIKALRYIAKMGLSAAKDEINAMLITINEPSHFLAGHLPIIEVDETDINVMGELDQYFVYEVEGKRTVCLRLWKVKTTCGQQYLILASSDGKAKDIAILDEESGPIIDSCLEIVGPFKDGQILGSFF
jgi:hypothetical protein